MRRSGKTRVRAGVSTTAGLGRQPSSGRKQPNCGIAIFQISLASACARLIADVVFGLSPVIRGDRGDDKQHTCFVSTVLLQKFSAPVRPKHGLPQFYPHRHRHQGEVGRHFFRSMPYLCRALARTASFRIAATTANR